MTKEEKKLIGEVIPKINAAKWELNARSRVKILTEAAEALDKLAKAVEEAAEEVKEAKTEVKKAGRSRKKKIEVPVDPTPKEK